MRKSAFFFLARNVLDPAVPQTSIRAHIGSTLQSTARTAKNFSPRLTIFIKERGMDLAEGISTLDSFDRWIGAPLYCILVCES
jgi:hypothetical protein